MTRFILPTNHYSLKSVPDVAEICEILQHFKITYFCYSRFFNDGSAFVLINNGESFEYHCKKQYPLSPPVTADNVGKKFHYLPFLDQVLGKEIKAASQVFQDYRNIFNVSYPLYFIENNLDYTDVYIYATNNDNVDAVNFYLNNLDILEKFKFYFREKAHKLIERSNKNRIIFPKHMYSAMHEFIDTKAKEGKNKKFLNQLTPNIYRLNKDGVDVKITKRELEVLENLSMGCTLKETSQNLKLSPRTVEEYFNNIKSKFRLDKKSELIKLMVELEIL